MHIKKRLLFERRINMEELLRIIKRLGLTRDDVICEAECVEEYGEWQHMALMGYGYDELMEAADKMAA